MKNRSKFLSEKWYLTVPVEKGKFSVSLENRNELLKDTESNLVGKRENEVKNTVFEVNFEGLLLGFLTKVSILWKSEKVVKSGVHFVHDFFKNVFFWSLFGHIGLIGTFWKMTFKKW